MVTGALDIKRIEAIMVKGAKSTSSKPVVKAKKMRSQWQNRARLPPRPPLHPPRLLHQQWWNQISPTGDNIGTCSKTYFHFGS